MTHTASEVMDPTPLQVAPELPVKELASLLVQNRVDGACVVAGGALVGVVTTMDLVFQSRTPHLPSFFHFLEALIPLESTAKVEHDLKKLAGATVRDIMTTDVVTAAPGDAVERVAELMVTRHLTVVPIIDAEGRLAGAVTKAGILRKAYGLS